MLRTQTRQVKFAVPEELANSVEELAKKCGVEPVDVVCVALKFVTELASGDEGLKYLQEHAPQLESGNVD